MKIIYNRCQIISINIIDALLLQILKFLVGRINLLKVLSYCSIIR